MKILMGYDGSECAEAAITDLGRAGLPPAVDLRIVSVSETVLPPPLSYTLPSAGAIELQKLLEGQARELAAQAAGRIQLDFPTWKIEVVAHPGSPANALIGLADEWQPDLIIVGSHGRSGLGRLILGSVSQTVLNEAHTSVRIARAGAEPVPPTGPVRIIVGIDGSAIAEAAVAAIAARHWPAGSRVCLLNADFNVSPMAAEYVLKAIASWIAEERARVAHSVEQARQTLESAGLTVEVVVKPGEPKELLLREAESWQADTIFVGAKNLTHGGRLRLGSVSAAIAARAHCTVEVVRIPRHA
jgi:nucleotide-binding universal stress UspA family protein